MPHRILVIEEKTDHRATLAVLLRSVGHTVKHASSLTYALTLADAFRPTVVLVDIALPFIEDHSTLTTLRAAFKEAPLFAMMAAEDEHKKVSWAPEFDARLVKPVNFIDIERLLGNRAR